MNRIKRGIPIVFWAAVCLAGLWLSFRNVETVRRSYPGWSLHFEEEITEEQAVQSRRYFRSQEKKYAVWPTFWRERREEMRTFRGAMAAKAVCYDGDPALALPVNFYSGGYPGESDSTGAAVSAPLAWELWGSLEVLGQHFQIGETEYCVCGVFENREKTAILCGVGQGGWSNVEITDKKRKIEREEMQRLPAQAGLPEYAYLIDGGGMASLMTFAAYAPLGLAVFLLLFRMIRLFPRHSLRRSAAVFSFWLLLALSLPWLLTQLPSWLVPTKWSNFAFWSELAERFGSYMREWLLLAPQDKDIAVKAAIAGQACILCLMPMAMKMLWNCLHPPGRKKRL